MCYFMFAITDNEINPLEVNKNEAYDLYIRDYTSYVKDREEGLHYYDISNGHCACEIVVSSFSRINEVKNILKNMSEKGSFRFVVIDSEDEEKYLSLEHNQKLEHTLESFEKETIKIEELLQKYPNMIDFNKVYLVS